jgi:hypothetical protein
MARAVFVALAMLVALLFLGGAPSVKGDALGDALIRARKCVPAARPPGAARPRARGARRIPCCAPAARSCARPTPHRCIVKATTDAVLPLRLPRALAGTLYAPRHCRSAARGAAWPDEHRG